MSTFEMGSHICMTQYELLFVLPGTLSEADAPGVAGSVKDAVGEMGAQ